MNNSRKYIILIAYLLAIGLSSVAQQVRPVYPVKPLTQEDISRRQRIPVGDEYTFCLLCCTPGGCR